MKCSQNRIVIIIALPALLLAVAANTAPAASISAVTFIGPHDTSSNSAPADSGLEFSTSDYIKITDLGIFDFSPNGLAEMTPSSGIGGQVALYYGSGPLAGTLIASTNILSGTGDPSIVGPQSNYAFRFHDIPDVIIAPGTYRIASLNANTDLQALTTASPLSVASGITLLHGYDDTATGSVHYPSDGSVIADNVFKFGPNFLFSTEVPEPGSLSIIGGALLLLSRVRRRA